MEKIVREEEKEAAAAATTSPQLRPYDFRRPYKARAASASWLEPLHATFAARVARSLSQHLRLEVVVTLATVEQLRYDEFLYSISPATCLGVLRVDPPGAQAILDLSLPVVHPMILRLLGGSPHAPHAHPRGLTDIEKSLALQIVERAAGELAETWSVAAAGGPLTVREESLESDPAAVRIMPDEELVTALRFDVRVGSSGGAGGTGGAMSLCLSDPILRELDPSAPPSQVAPTPAQTEAQRQDLHKNILEAAVELRALLAETHVRLSDVLDMQPGDVITTDKPAGDDVHVQVEGADKLQGQAGQLYGNRVVRLTGVPRIAEVVGDAATAPTAVPPAASESRSGDPS